jgi:hypothetical protein
MSIFNLNASETMELGAAVRARSWDLLEPRVPRSLGRGATP